MRSFNVESERLVCAVLGLLQGKPENFGRRLSHFGPFDCIGKCSPAVRRSRSPLSLWRFLLCSYSSLPSTAKTDRRKTERRARGTLCFTFKS